MPLQPSCLIADQCISGGVRLVKAIARKLFNQIKNLHSKGWINAFIFSPTLKNRALLCHLLGLFLTHRAAQEISPTQRIAGQLLRNLHHLFLVENDAVGRL